MPDLFIAQTEPKGRLRNTGFDNTSLLLERRSIDSSEQTIISSEESNQDVLPEKKTSSVTPAAAQSPENPLSQQSNEDIEQRNSILPLFASYWQNPRSIFFDTQEPDEHIILFVRKHFITNVPWIFSTVILLLLPPALLYFLHVINYSISFSPVIIQTIIILYYLFVLTNAFIKFLEWYYNISIITNKRILDLMLNDIISKKFSATKMSLVQDVSYQQTGAIQSIFNYANVLVQTAGTLENFVIEAAPNPEQVEHVIEDLIGKEVEVPDNHAAA